VNLFNQAEMKQDILDVFVRVRARNIGNTRIGCLRLPILPLSCRSGSKW